MYDFKVSPAVVNALPALCYLFYGRINNLPPQILVSTITTVGGVTFTMFTKNLAWIGDVYSAVIAPYYGGDVYCETWLNGTSVNGRPF